MTDRRALGRILEQALCGALLLLTAACSGNAAGHPPSASPSSRPTPSPTASPLPTTASFAESPNASPDYIFPLASSDHYSVVNASQFQVLMYRPLYWFGDGEKPSLDPARSLADPPQFSDGGKTVTITLKDYTWSDGQPITARDVQFWQNLVRFNKANWAAYVPGGYPDTIVGTKIINPRTIQFTLAKGYSTRWFTDNELSQITPLPQHAWDVTAAGGKVGDYDTTKAGARAVYKYLDSQAKDTSTYASNPLWSVVDGPWQLKSFSAHGRIVFVPNPAYGGPDKPHLKRFVEVPFTSGGAEFAALRSGSVDVGYVPIQDLAHRIAGYRLAPWVLFGFNYFPVNMHNPTVGAIFRKAYIRQAMEQLVDQNALVKKDLNGYGSPSCGPVPIVPANSYADAYEKSCPYSYDPAAAVATLTAHGWHVVPGGVTTCTDPAECGAGIAAGAKLEFQFVYYDGVAPFANEVKQIKKDAAKAGIVYDLVPKSLSDVVSTAVPCQSSQVNCSWQIAAWGGGWFYAPDYYPSGGQLFYCGAGANTSNYCNARDDANIRATRLAGNDPQNLSTYEDYVTQQVPFIWIPTVDYQLTLVNSRLSGVTPQNAYGAITPEDWQFNAVGTPTPASGSPASGSPTPAG